LNKGFRAVGRINFTGAYVGRAFQWAGVGSPENVVLDLRLMKVGTLLNHRNSWPAQGHLDIDGFVYDQIDNEAHPTAKVQLGWWLFRRGFVRGLFTPTKDEKYTIEKDGARPNSDNYPKFNALVYSLETFVPLLKLGIDEHWTPNANSGGPLKIVSFGALRLSTTTGGLLRCYLWFHIIAGWVLTTLWVGGLTGLVKT